MLMFIGTNDSELKNVAGLAQRFVGPNDSELKNVAGVVRRGSLKLVYATICFKKPTLVVFCTSSLCWRNTPVLTATEVTHIVLVVAIAAKRRHLPICPIFVWDSVCCAAKVAESPCLLATIHTRPDESF